MTDNLAKISLDQRLQCVALHESAFLSSLSKHIFQVVKGPPPKLRNDNSEFAFSDSYMTFVNMLTIADADHRPKYDKLLSTPYLTDMARKAVNVATYFSTVLNSMTEADFMSEANSDDAYRA